MISGCRRCRRVVVVGVAASVVCVTDVTRARCCTIDPRVCYTDYVTEGR
nr:MAG TPA: hypothetical protein [Caudoviricetes sp.]